MNSVQRDNEKSEENAAQPYGSKADDNSTGIARLLDCVCSRDERVQSRIESVFLGAVILVVGGLLTLPVIFYHINSNEVRDDCAISCVDPTVYI